MTLRVLADYKVSTVNFNFFVIKHIVDYINGYPLPSTHAHKILIDVNGSSARFLRALKFETLWCFQSIFEVQFLRRNTMVKKKYFFLEDISTLELLQQSFQFSSVPEVGIHFALLNGIGGGGSIILNCIALFKILSNTPFL